MKKIGFSDIKITEGFWREKTDMVINSTVSAVYERFKETNRFDALRCNWKEEGRYEGHIFWDSDVAKWIEGVAYLLQFERNGELEQIIDDAVEQIIKNSDENGYFNSYYLTVCQDERFTRRSHHELYCAGHLMEAAIAYNNATGKDAFLKAMCRYADYIEKVFKIEKSAAFTTPGHPELELALVRLYEATGEKRYLDLSKFFIDMHGNTGEMSGDNPFYNQDEIPLKERSTADGHCVRALYLMSGAADIAEKYNDKKLRDACKRVFNNIVNKRMYITGGVGSSWMGETFTIDYDLPNRTAYSETCAAISLAMFAGRMQRLDNSSIYADTVERVIYNGALSGISMDGKAFFYENPLEILPEFNNVNRSSKNKSRYPITQRKEVFGCSCCPPNILRFIASIADYAYTYTDDTLYVNQYLSSETVTDNINIIQETDYPSNGKIKITYSGNKEKLALRIPDWCRSFKLSCEYTLQNGYAIIQADGKAEILLELDMPVTIIKANREVPENAGRVAVTRGPIVYCIEGIDNGRNLKSVAIDINAEFSLADSEFLVPSLKTNAFKEKETKELYSPAQSDDYESISLKLIPYYAFANRGESEMHVWLLRK